MTVELALTHCGELVLSNYYLSPGWYVWHVSQQADTTRHCGVCFRAIWHHANGELWDWKFCQYCRVGAHVDCGAVLPGRTRPLFVCQDCLDDS